MVQCHALWPLTRPQWAPALGNYATQVFHNGPTCAHSGVYAAATVVPVTTGLLIESRCHPLWAHASIHGGTAVSAVWAGSAAKVPSRAWPQCVCD